MILAYVVMARGLQQRNGSSHLTIVALWYQYNYPCWQHCIDGYGWIHWCLNIAMPLNDEIQPLPHRFYCAVDAFEKVVALQRLWRCCCD